MLSLLVAATLTAVPAPTPRVVVLDVTGGALNREEAGLVRDAIAREIASTAKWDVLSSEEIRRVLDIEAEKQKMDCDTDACLAELGAALGASRVLHGNVARLGSSYVMTISLIDPDQARALGRASARADDAEQLYEKVPDTVDELLGAAKAKPPPFPVLTVSGTAISIIAGVLTVASGATMFALYDSTQDPDGDPAMKQAFLDYRVPLGATVLVSAGTLVVGGGVLGIGLIVE